MKRPTAAALDVNIALWSKSQMRQKECTVTQDCKAENNLLKAYRTKDVVAERDADVIFFSLL